MKARRIAANVAKLPELSAPNAKLPELSAPNVAKPSSDVRFWGVKRTLRAKLQLDDLPGDVEAIRSTLLDAFDRQRQVDLAARLVARHLKLGHSPQSLIATLARAVLREDAGFHAYQMLEAGVRQFMVWDNTDEGRHILIAVARYLAAHSPTERAALQTADIARRLMRGGELHHEAVAS